MKPMNSKILDQVLNKLVKIGQKHVSKGNSLLKSMNINDEMIKIASKRVIIDPIEKRLRTGYIHTISKDATQFTSLPEKPKRIQERKRERTPGSAMSKYPSGSETTAPYVGEQHGGDQVPAASTLANRNFRFRKYATKKALTEIIEQLKKEDRTFIDVRDITMMLSQKNQQSSFDIEDLCKTLSDNGITLMKMADSDESSKLYPEKSMGDPLGQQEMPEGEFDDEQVKKGIQVEMEHQKTIDAFRNQIEQGNDLTNEQVAEMIAHDHLTEDPEYYTKLQQIEGNEIEASPDDLGRGRGGPGRGLGRGRGPGFGRGLGKPLSNEERLKRHRIRFPEDKMETVEDLPPRGTGLGHRGELEGLQIEAASIDQIKDNIEHARDSRAYNIERLQEKGLENSDKERYEKARRKWEKEIDRLDRELSRAMKQERKQEREEAKKKKDKEMEMDQTSITASLNKKSEETFEEGETVELVKTTDPYTKLKPETKGTVQSVDDAGVIHVRWTDGSTLDINLNVGDMIKRVPPEEERELMELGFVKSAEKPFKGVIFSPTIPQEQSAVVGVSAEGGTIRTSPVTKVEPYDEGKYYIETLNSQYKVIIHEPQSIAGFDGVVITAQEPIVEPTFELEKWLSPTEYQELQRVIDLRQKTWGIIADREERNIQEGMAPYTNIDYNEVEVLNSQIKQYQELAKSRKAREKLPGPPLPEEGMPPMEEKLPPPPEGIPPLGPEEGVLTKRPEELPEYASQENKFIKKATMVTVYNRQFEAIPVWDIDGMKVKAYEINDESGRKLFQIPADEELSKYQLQNEIAKKFGQRSNNMNKQSVVCQDFPEVCKNCKNLIIPAGYNELTFMDHKDKPFCPVSDSNQRIGFRYSFARDCRGYDPILKDLPQKVETPTETIFNKLEEKGEKPILKKTSAIEKKDDDDAIERGKKICPKCVEQGYFAPVGEYHPAHDYHLLWMIPFGDVIHNPKGVCLPRSMAYQSNPDSGLNQFDTNANRIVKNEKVK